MQNRADKCYGCYDTGQDCTVCELTDKVNSLTSELTSAKEEIERLRGTVTDKRLFDKLQTALSSERKETERLREAVITGINRLEWVTRDIPSHLTFQSLIQEDVKTMRAALQSQQGEDQCGFEDGNGWCNSPNPSGCKHSLASTNGWACEREL